MLDFVLAAALIVLVVRGWRRGMIREILLAVLILAAVIAAIRGSAPVGRFIAALTGAAPETSRLIAGVSIFTVLLAIPWIMRLWAGTRWRRAAPQRWQDRASGAVVAAGGGVLAATVVLAALVAWGWPGLLVRGIGASPVASYLADPDRIVLALVDVVSGDAVLSEAVRLRNTHGALRLPDPGAQRIDLRAESSARLGLDRRAGAALLDRVNEERVVDGAAPVAASGSLSAVAATHATAMYEDGWFAHADGRGIGIAGRLDAAGLPRTGEVEVMAVALSLDGVIAAWRDDPLVVAGLIDRSMRRGGAAVVNGPLGRLVVVVLTG